MSGSEEPMSDAADRIRRELANRPPPVPTSSGPYDAVLLKAADATALLAERDELRAEVKRLRDQLSLSRLAVVVATAAEPRLRSTESKVAALEDAVRVKLSAANAEIERLRGLCCELALERYDERAKGGE